MTTRDDGRVDLPRTDRPDAPAYLTRHRERTAAAPDGSGTADGEGPLYLRRFRERRQAPAAAPPAWQGTDLGTTHAWAEVTRSKEIVPERRDQQADVVTDVYLVRHGETQGYSSESGLTPLGSWQSHRRGQEIARRVQTGHRVVVAHAPTNRARQTAEHLRRGLLDNAQLFGRDADVGELVPMPEFGNFSVATPEGPRDVTSAFRRYHREMEKYERIGLGERPGWLVEVDRFWNVQQGGGDPITHWLTMPMLYFEPPISCVRRFWAGIQRISRETPGRSVVVATHSGPIRAFATWAMGYDPGEPFNAEFVRVRLVAGGVTALVLYRNRVQEVRVPELADLPATNDGRFDAAAAEPATAGPATAGPATAAAAGATADPVTADHATEEVRPVTSNQQREIVWFDDVEADERACLGGKSASLGEMVAAGLPVPPGFSVTTHAFRAARDGSGVLPAIEAALAGLDAADTADVSRRAARVRELILSWPMPAGLEAGIRTAYAGLCDRTGRPDVAVAVRSSATCEDSPDASFAGEHDTYLWVRGGDDVVEHVRRCWASLFTDRAVAYRTQLGYAHLDVEMCVAVQKMVLPRAAGVAFTLNPSNGDRSAVAIDSAWGFGEGVVSGDITPDNFLVDKVLGTICQRTVSAKAHAYRLGTDDHVHRVELAAAEASAPSVTDPEIGAIATLARRAEKHYGCPQDVEWAIDTELPDGENVVLLQARPETVWSRKKVRVSTGLDPMTSIVATLSNPLHSRRS